MRLQVPRIAFRDVVRVEQDARRDEPLLQFVKSRCLCGSRHERLSVGKPQPLNGVVQTNLYFQLFFQHEIVATSIGVEQNGLPVIFEIVKSDQ